MTDAYATLDRDWRVVYTNPAATEVYRQTTGLAPAEYLGRTHWEVFPWTVGTIVEREYRRAVTERVAVHFELFYDPTETWFEVHAYPSTEGLGLYFRDINERKLGELARIAAEKERDRFFNLSIDLLIVANFDGYFVGINPACEPMLGFTSAELMAQPYLDFVHPDDLAHTLAAAKSLSTGNAVVNFENRYRCKDGSYRWISWSAMPYNQNNVWYAIGHDITERKQMEAALRQNESQLRLFVQHAPAGVAMFDRDMRYLVASDRWIDSYDLPERDIVGRSHYDIFPDLPQRWKDIHQRCLAGAIESCEEDPFPRANGSLDWVRWEIHPWYTNPDEVGGIIIFSDVITDRKLAAQRLQESEQRLRTGVEVAGVGLAKFDYATNLVELSPEAAALYGFAPENSTITREQIHNTFHPDERAELEAVIAQILDPQSTRADSSAREKR